MQKIAILGAGFMGMTHADAYTQNTDAALAAVCDSNRALAEEFAKKYGCPAYTDAEEMLRCVEADVLDICLPTFLHEDYALLGAKHKKHVFCEKPVALSLESYDRMVQAIQNAGTQLFVGQVVRFWPEYAAATRMLEEGAFGEVKAVHASRISVHPNWSAWYRKAENSGGGLFDLHLHDIDYLCSVFGRPKAVYATGKKNTDGCWNVVASSLRFANGLCATVEGIIEMQEGYPFTMELRIVGEESSLEYRMRAGANLENVAAAQRESWVYQNGLPPRTLEAPPDDAYKLELDYFIHCLNLKQPPARITLASVRITLEAILAIRHALESGQEVLL